MDRGSRAVAGSSNNVAAVGSSSAISSSARFASSTPDLKIKNTSQSNLANGKLASSSANSVRSGATASRASAAGKDTSKALNFPKVPKKAANSANADAKEAAAPLAAEAMFPAALFLDPSACFPADGPASSDASAPFPETLPALASTIDAALMEFKAATAARRKSTARTGSKPARSGSPFHSDPRLEGAADDTTRPSTANELLPEADASASIPSATEALNDAPDDSSEDTSLSQLLSGPLTRSAALAKNLQFNGALFLETNVRHWVDKLGSTADLTSDGVPAALVAAPILEDMGASLENYLRASSAADASAVLAMPTLQSRQLLPSLLRFLRLHLYFLSRLRDRQRSLAGFLDEFAKMEEWFRVWKLVKGDQGVEKVGERLAALVDSIERYRKSQTIASSTNKAISLGPAPPEIISESSTATTMETADQTCNTDPLWLVVRKSSKRVKDYELGTGDLPCRTGVKIIEKLVPSAGNFVAQGQLVTMQDACMDGSSQTMAPPSLCSTSTEILSVPVSEAANQAHSLRDLKLLSDQNEGDELHLKHAQIATEELKVFTKSCFTEPSMEQGWVEIGIHEKEIGVLEKRLGELDRVMLSDKRELLDKIEDLERQRETERERLVRHLNQSEAQNEALQIQLSNLATSLSDTRIHLLRTSDEMSQAGDRSLTEIARLKGELLGARGEIEVGKAKILELARLVEKEEGKVEDGRVELAGMKRKLLEVEARALEAEDGRNAALRQLADLETELELLRGRAKEREPRLRVKGRHAGISPSPRRKNGPLPPLPHIPSIVEDELPAASDIATGPTTPTHAGSRTPVKTDHSPEPPTGAAFAAAVAASHSRRSWSPPRMPAVEMVAGPGPAAAPWAVRGAGEIVRNGPTPRS